MSKENPIFQATNMRSSSFSLFSFSFFLFLFLHGAVSANLVGETCKKASQSNPKISFQFCLSTLQANPASKTADLQGLGVIATGLIVPKANNVASQAAKLLKNQKLDAFSKKCLNDCSSLYSDAVPTLKEAANAFKTKDYSTANVKLSSAMDASLTCEAGFKEKKGLVSPLTKENNEFSQVTSIALAMTNMFH